MTSTFATEAPLPAPGSGTGAARARLDRLRGRARTGIWIEALGVLALLLVAYAVPTWITDRFLRLEWAWRALLLATFAVVLLRMLARRLFRPLAVTLDDEEMALAVERRAPGVRQALISALQFDDALGRGTGGADSRAMMAAVVADTTSRLEAIPFHNAIDGSRVRRFAGGIAVALLFFGIWIGVDAGSFGIWARRNLLLTNVDWPRYTTLAFAEIRAVPQGDPLTVHVKATGAEPEQVFIDYTFKSGEHGTEPMSATGDGEFTWAIDAVIEDVVLRAEGGDAMPVEMRVVVVERPRIEDFALTVVFPDYMGREPELVPPTEGDVRVPRGGKVRIAGRSQKKIVEAFALFGEESKLPLTAAPDGRSFAGEIAPDSSGLLVVDVIDTDKLGAGTPPKVLLRVGEDKAPSIDFRLRGVGSLITAFARIPGDLKVKDDFGLRAIDAEMRAVDDQSTDRKPDEATPKVEVPFENVAATYDEKLDPNAVRYESRVSVDLRQWSPENDENSPNNRVRPGMLVSLHFGATDNFGPGDPHHGYGETMSFRVVTREKLAEELRRRQVEQRGELEKLIKEHEAAMLEFGELVQVVLQKKDEGREKQVQTRFKALARQQIALGRRTAFIAETYQRILWEYENNRLIDATRVRQMESVIPEPLTALGKEAFPASGRRVDAFGGSRDEAASIEAVSGYAEIDKRLLAVLKEMEQAESLALILEALRDVIKIEDSVLQDVEKKAREAETDILGPGKNDKPNKDKKGK
ncbi:MAG: hypothetical protein U1E73_02190 [Planctomycetota bacterium]